MYVPLHRKASKLGLAMQLRPFCILMNFLYYSDLGKGGALRKEKRDPKWLFPVPKAFP